MNTCKQFDKYRDGELSAAQRSGFKSHLVSCADCRAKMSLLDNVVHILRQDATQPVDLAERIARQAFRQNKSWDALLLSWLRPGPALAALGLLLMIFSFIWFVPDYRQKTLLSEYESLMNQADAISQSTSVTQASNESEFVFWLQQEVNLQ